MNNDNGTTVSGGTKGAEQSVSSSDPDVLYIHRKEMSLQDEIRSGIGYLEKLTHQLDDKLSCLPRVDEKGWSECPFAERLYIEKADLERKVEEQVRVLLALKPALTQLIKKRHHQVNVVMADGSKLHSAEAKQQYEFALHDARRELKTLQDLLRDLEDVGSRAKQVVTQARGKTFAGKKYVDESPSSLASTGTSLPSVLVAENKQGMERTASGSMELESLLAMGPLGL